MAFALPSDVGLLYSCSPIQVFLKGKHPSFRLSSTRRCPLSSASSTNNPCRLVFHHFISGVEAHKNVNVSAHSCGGQMDKFILCANFENMPCVPITQMSFCLAVADPRGPTRPCPAPIRPCPPSRQTAWP